ncbi:MAG: tetratricopeptide repeat protein [Pseudomonadota bacterium]
MAALLAACSSRNAQQDAQVSTLLGAAPRPAEAEGYSAFLVARFAALTNDPRSALAGYERALSAEPGASDLAERAVFAALTAGTFDDAVRLAKLAEPERAKAAPLLRLTLAVDALQNQRWDEAERILNEPTEGGFAEQMITPLASWVAFEQNGLQAGADRLLQSRTGGATFLPAIEPYFLALMKLADGEDQDALILLDALWETGPRLAVATELQARLLAANGRTLEARSKLSAFRREIGPNPAIDRLRREIESGGDIAVVRPTALKGAALSLYMPAAALAAQTDTDFPGVFFAMALALDPEMDIARTLWAQSLDRSGRRGDALAVLSEIGPDSPFYATARGQIAWLHRRGGQGQFAIDVAAEAIAATSDRDLMVQMGDLLTTLDRDGEAEELFAEVITLDTAAGAPDWRLYLARGAARERLGRWPQAEVDLREALRLSPDNPAVLNHLGYSLVDRGLRLEEGLRLISRAVDLRPRSGAIIDSLGWAYFKLGDFPRAVVHLERAVELEPSDALINEHLGDAYWRVGRRREAGFQWRRALELSPEPERVGPLQRKLQSGLPALARSLSVQGEPAGFPEARP